MRKKGIYNAENNKINYKAQTNRCIVLDLDQTLIATQKDIQSLKDMGIMSKPELLGLRDRIYNLEMSDFQKKGDGSSYRFWGIMRPHIKEFLIFCFSYFEYVVVWSAGKRKYVEAIVDHIFRDIQEPYLVLTYDDIVMASDGNVEKPLEKMFKIIANKGGNVSFSNTLALDDNPSTFRKNKDNGVLIPPYDPAPNPNAFGRDDPTLQQFMYWLVTPEIMSVSNVSELEKSSIFEVSLDTYKKNFI